MKGDPIAPESSRAEIDEYRFSPGRRAAGLLVFSGQLGVEANGTISMSPARQAERAFEKVAELLAEAGAGWGDVISLTSLHVGSVADAFAWFRPVKDRWVVDPFPTWTAIQVVGLAEPDAVIELVALAAASETVR